MSVQKRLPALDLLRAAAISWVVVFHLLDGYAVNVPRALYVFMLGGSEGVDLFFVLSGFLIGSIAVRELTQSGSLRVGHFWRRRWMRTLPAYYVTFALVVCSALVVRRSSPWAHPWAYAIFLQNYLSVGSRFNWSWSLCVEEHFYLGLPLIVLAGRALLPRVSVRALVASIGVSAFAFSVITRAVIFARTGPMSDWHTYETTVYCVTHTRLDGLGMGLLIASLPRFTLPRAVAAASIVVGLSLVAASVVFMITPLMQEQTFAFSATGFGLVLLALLGQPSFMDLRVPGAAFVADVSYSLYLLHPMVFAALLPYRDRFGHWTVAGALAIAASFVVAYVLRRFVERPFLRLRDRRENEDVRAVVAARGAPVRATGPQPGEGSS